MLTISRRMRLMLDALFIVGALFALITVGVVAHEFALWRGIGVALGVAGCVACYVAWRRARAGDARVVVPLIGFAVVATLVGDGSWTLLLLFVCLIVVVVERGAGVGIAASVLLTVGVAVVMAVGYQRAIEDIAVQTASLLVLLGLGLVVGQVIREADQARRENERLLAELRASLDAEKDHVLAEERARAASDLHDGLGHQLTAIRMGLDFADRMRDRDPEAAWTEVNRARDLSVVALERMRVWVRALDPVSVGSLTGTAAFEAVADAFRGTGLDVDVVTTGDEQDLDRESALFLLRVIQEGLTNALRHGGAGRVSLVVDHGDGVSFSLTDDGSPPQSRTGVNHGYGLRSLSDRAERLGGTVEAGWSDDGFRLVARVPSRAADVRTSP